MDKKILRIIDANANRVREALRVCEEITRLLLNNKPMTNSLKNVRHSLKAALEKAGLPYTVLISERESSKDVGKSLVVFTHQRVSARDIFISNMKRVQEALRVLEEFSKMFSKSASGDFQKIRFAVYTIEKKILMKLKK
jgi:thiamine-phosphate pyrophosphorylase